MDELLGLLTSHPAMAAAFAAAMLAEYLLGRLNDHDTHDPGETAASFVIAAGNKLIGLATAGLVATPLLWLHAYRLFDIPATSPLTLAALFLAVDLAYYVHHIAMHKLRWLWATHAVHHSSTKLNLTAAVRLGWGGQLTGGVAFYAPLVVIGFHPFAVFGMLAVNLAYQFLLHLADAPHLGPLEHVLNTPRHHQVHHASNDGCLDRNFGGVLIVFDRLFGTFAAVPAGEPLRYGLKLDGISPRNPLAVLTGEWRRLARDVRRARGFKERLKAFISVP